MDHSLNPVQLDPVTKAFLEGVYDDKCVLYKLKGLWHILHRIFRHVKKYWKESIVETRPIRYKTRFVDGDMLSYLNLSKKRVNLPSFPFIPDTFLGRVFFPLKSNIDINMMPFILHTEFKKCHLPDTFHSYWKNIISHCIFDKDEIGKICYLTIQESKVKKNCTQRRPGLHTERPGRLQLHGASIDGVGKGEGNSLIQHSAEYHDWGHGIASYSRDRIQIKGGIFMASDVALSCRVWDCQIMDDNCIGHLGDVEHLRSLLPESEIMEENCLYWLTDRTPHESLPLKKKTRRHFFRLVTSQLSHWFEEHSTKNPLGVVPDPNITKIVKGSKFERGEAYIVSDHSK